MTELELFDHQRELMQSLDTLGTPARALLFYKTGAGKSYASVLAVRELGHRVVTVVAPPSTHDAWLALGKDLGVLVTTMSHAKFRMKTTKLSRHEAVIADEFHMFGGHKGQGWKKLDTLARHLQAPLLLLSATPNYNDIERCYCAMHILSPEKAHGGYLQFLYTHCVTEQNPFGMEPIVTGFKHYTDAAHFLSSMDKVFYLKDDTVFSIDDEPYAVNLPAEFRSLSYDARRHRVMASQMEQRHTLRLHALVDPSTGKLWDHVERLLMRHATDLPVLIFCNSARIAGAVAKTLAGLQVELVTGTTPKQAKLHALDMFRSGGLDFLIGTATLATGTDGLDKVCNTLVIVDDTDDDALRRQLIGRIMPRGDSVSTAVKKIVRLQPILP